jgi:hypothetical protein
VLAKDWEMREISCFQRVNSRMARQTRPIGTACQTCPVKSGKSWGVERFRAPDGTSLPAVRGKASSDNQARCSAAAGPGSPVNQGLRAPKLIHPGITATGLAVELVGIRLHFRPAPGQHNAGALVVVLMILLGLPERRC